MTYDVIVVGSGPAGVNAAAPLVEAGWNVAIVDYGNRDQSYALLIPQAPFSQLRRSDPEQHRYLLGNRFEGLPLGEVRVGAQLTPPRQYACADASRLMPVTFGNFSAMESLALGGLGNAWGAGAFVFSDDELRRAGLEPDRMREHYAARLARIGVSGVRDDLLPFLGDSESLMPPFCASIPNAERVLARYRVQRSRLHERGSTSARPDWRFALAPCRAAASMATTTWTSGPTLIAASTARDGPLRPSVGRPILLTSIAASCFRSAKRPRDWCACKRGTPTRAMLRCCTRDH